MNHIMHQQKIFSEMNNARSKRGDPRKSKRIEDLLRRARNKGHLFKYAEKLRKKLLADEDRHISPNQVSHRQYMSPKSTAADFTIEWYGKI